MLGGRSLGGVPLGGRAGESFMPDLINSATIGSEYNQKGFWFCTYDVQIDSETTLYFTDHSDPVEVFGRTYTPYPIKRDAVEQTSRAENRNWNVNVANVDGLLVAYLENGKMIGQNIVLSTLFMPEGTDTPLYKNQDTYEILGASIDESRAFVTFSCGKYNFFKTQLPHTRWNDVRCNFVYKDTTSCSYGRDDFKAISRINLKTGGDGAKISGWNALNVTNAALGADIDITRSSYLTYTFGVDFNPAWSGTTTTAPYLYRSMPSGDYSFEIQFESNGGDKEYGGIIIRRASTPGYWYRFNLNADSSKITVNRNDGTGSDNAVVNTSITKSYRWLKVTKVDDKHSFYLKEAGQTSYEFIANDTRTAWSNASNNEGYLLGIFAAASNTSTRAELILFQFDAFNLISGGYSTCSRTLSDCRVRDNARRFGGSPGIQHNTIRL